MPPRGRTTRGSCGRSAKRSATATRSEAVWARRGPSLTRSLAEVARLGQLPRPDRHDHNLRHVVAVGDPRSEPGAGAELALREDPQVEGASLGGEPDVVLRAAASPAGDRDSGFAGRALECQSLER